MATLHLELAQRSRRRTATAGVPYGAPYIDGRTKLAETGPTKLLGVEGCIMLNGAQFIRLSRELGELSPPLRGEQLQLLIDLCLVANCSEEFFLSVSKDQWLRTAVTCNKHPNALFSSDAIERQRHTLLSSITIHSNVIPWHPYWPKLQALRDEAPEAGARARLYFPSTFLEVALTEEKSLVEKLSEREGKEEECAIAKQRHDRDERNETRLRRPFWKIEPGDVKLVNSNFAGGSQAAVWKISWRGGVFARKLFKDETTFERELEVLQKVSHPHIVYSFGVSSSSDASQHSLLMELLDRDLSTLIEDRVRLRGLQQPPFSRLDSVDILRQVAKAMAHIHGLEEPVVHGDLKPANILVSHFDDVGQYFVKVADFGSARILESNSSARVMKARGTTQWCAPEVLKENASLNHDPKKIDVYSFGIVAFQVLSGLEPYEPCPSLLVKRLLNGVPVHVPYAGVESRRSLIQGVIAGTLRPPLQDACSRPNFWSDRLDLVALVESCWHADSSARPGFSEVVHRLESIFNDLIQRPTNGSIVCSPPQVNGVDGAQAKVVLDAPQVHAVDDAPKVLSFGSVQDRPMKASRGEWTSRIRQLLPFLSLSSPRTNE